MPVDPITSINRISRLTAPGNTDGSGKATSALDSFGQILSDALSSLSQNEASASNAIVGLAAGEDVELHQVMLAMQEVPLVLMGLRHHAARAGTGHAAAGSLRREAPVSLGHAAQGPTRPAGRC